MGIGIIDNFDVNAKKPIDSRFGPYESPTEALNAINIVTQRFQGLVVLITGSAYLTDGRPTEYWFQDGIDDNNLVVKPGGSDSNTFPFTGSALITGSLTLTGSLATTGSVNLTLDTSSTAVDKVMMYDDTTGQVFITSSEAIGGLGTRIKATGSGIEPQGSNPGGFINTITIKDFTTDVTVTFDAGNLTFLFGLPQPPTPSLTINNFNRDRFNKQLDSYTISAPFNLNGFSLVSASLFDTTTGELIGTTDTLSNLNQSLNTSGSRSYKLELTSSNPADDNLEFDIKNAGKTLLKQPPGKPTVEFTPDVQLGTTSTFGAVNEIEIGATGSITFLPKTGSDNGWEFVPGTLDVTPSSPQTVTELGTADLNIFATADYSSSGAGGTDNDPPLYPGNSSAARQTSNITTFRKGISLRHGVTVGTDTSGPNAPKDSFTSTELLDIESWDTTLGGNIGTIEAGKNTSPEINGSSISFQWVGIAYLYIIIPSNVKITQIKNPATGVVTLLNNTFGNTFTDISSPLSIDYRVYRSTAMQVMSAGASPLNLQIFTTTD